MSSVAEVHVVRHGAVANVVLARPPHNHVNGDVMGKLTRSLFELDADPECRAVVLSSGVSAFCAGADLAASAAEGRDRDPADFYAEALKVYQTRKPLVAAIAGAAVGAGLGLALAADFRVTCEEARFSANFNLLGFHPGFGLSVTLPRLIGQQQAARLFYTGRRIGGKEAVDIGLADSLVPNDEVLASALLFAQEIAASAPLAVLSTRETLRQGLYEEIFRANQRELLIQRDQFRSADFQEGVRAMAERRKPVFTGR